MALPIEQDETIDEWTTLEALGLASSQLRHLSTRGSFSREDGVSIQFCNFRQENAKHHVLLLTGWDESFLKYGDVISELLADGFNVYAMDWRSQGLSGRLLLDPQAQLQATDALMTEGQFVVGPVTSWLASFVEWADNTTEYSANVSTSGGYRVYGDRDTFYPALTNFTRDGDNVRFLADIVYNDEGEIEISRSRMFLVGLTDTPKSVESLMDVRDVVDQSELEPQPFGFSSIYIFFEMFVVIYKELLINFLLALVAVIILSFLVLGKPVIVILVSLTVAIVDVDLLGFVYHWGLEVNAITVVELVMAVGLVVDYMVHIVHYFLHQDAGTPKDVRIANALGEIGPSVMVGAATTFLGIMPMAFASNVIFRVFFKMFLVIITFGFWHGVAFIPVALSLLPESMVSSPNPSARTAARTVPKGSRGTTEPVPAAHG